jgi:hypothetical protein
MPLTKATTNVVNLDKDTLINGLTVGRGGGNDLYSTALGDNALQANTTGIFNTAVGAAALTSNTIGNQNTAVGNASLRYNTIGDANTAVGSGALYSNTTGGNNTASGSGALYSNTTGTNNAAFGNASLASNTTGGNNTASGFNALYSNTTGEYNTASGSGALYSNTTGTNNAAFGNASLASNTTGFNNAAIGSGALQSNTTGHSNSAVGALALANNATFSNVGGFGYNAQVSGSNQIRIGDTNITSVTCQTNAWSDERDKADIRDTVLGLDFIKELRPVDYKWDYREDYRPEAPASVSKPAELKEDASAEEKAKYAQELAEYNAYKVKLDKWLEDCKWSNLVHNGTHKRTRFHHGLIAQEVKAVIEKTGIDFGGFQDHTIKGGDAVMTIGYTELIGPLIKAVQELSAKVAELEAK